MSNEKEFKQVRKPAVLNEDKDIDVNAIMNQVINESKGEETSNINDPDAPFKLEGNVPPVLQKLLKKNGLAKEVTENQQKNSEEYVPNKKVKSTNPKLEELRNRLKNQTAIYEEVKLPSLGKFYSDGEAPSNGILNVRRMTGEEEEILATTRFLKKGIAINMLFQNCVKEKIKPEKWVTADRTYLLMYLRGISSGSYYDVEVKCPVCTNQFDATIDLDALLVKYCPEHFGPNSLKGTLPLSGFNFKFKFPTVGDEVIISNYEEKRRKSEEQDDSTSFRLATLIEDIEGLSDKPEIMELLKELPLCDFAYLKDIVNEVPFGTETKVDLYCSSCGNEFKMEMPLESSFFFPRRKKANRTQA